MKFSASAALLALAASMQEVSAAGRLGFALGTKRVDGSCKSQADYEADFAKIHTDSGSTLVRMYAASDCNAAALALPAAKNKGMQIVMGIWPDVPQSYDADKAALQKYAPQYKAQIYAITVGSEGLYRKSYTAAFLVSKIQDMRKALPQFRYGFADTWNKINDGTADPVVRVADLVLSNAFSYWQGATIDQAAGVLFSDTQQAFNHVNAIAAGKELWIGETGWPTKGTKYQNSVPSVANAARFYKEGICGAHAKGWKVFSFEAFDELWKPDSTGDDGTVGVEKYWGVMDANRNDKFPIRC